MYVNTTAIARMREHVEKHKAKERMQFSLQGVQEILKAMDCYRNLCKLSGVCMSCIDGAPDTFGCWDCQNTGIDHNATGAQNG